ncbi:MAG TPA: nuclear transport factor 2 family protein [Pyrinomonadaceae bacterium]
MNKVALSVICLLVTASSVLAQTAAPDAAELTRLLNEFLAGASRNDPAAHERFWADDLIYTRSAGRRVSKADIMKDVREAPAPKPDDPKTVYTAEDIRIQQYGNTAIVAFRLVATTETAGARQVQNLLNSGTFVKRNGKWQVVNWQSTRMPRTEDENRKEIAAVVAAFHNALAARDAKEITALTDAGFVWLGAQRKEITRKELTDASSQIQYEKPETTNETISLFGETAVVRGEGRYSMTLVNQGGAWKVVAFHTN